MTNSDGTLLFGYATQFTMVGFGWNVPKNVDFFCLFVCLILSLGALIVLYTHVGACAKISSEPEVTDHSRLGNNENNDQLWCFKAFFETLFGDLFLCYKILRAISGAIVFLIYFSSNFYAHCPLNVKCLVVFLVVQALFKHFWGFFEVPWSFLMLLDIFFTLGIL